MLTLTRSASARAFALSLVQAKAFLACISKHKVRRRAVQHPAAGRGAGGYNTQEKHR
jgi:hypothetical protein